MKQKVLNINITTEQLLQEATTVDVWEKIKPSNVEFLSVHIMQHKVVSVKGQVQRDNGEVSKCIWNYQGICIDIDTLTIIEEGCL